MATKTALHRMPTNADVRFFCASMKRSYPRVSIADKASSGWMRFAAWALETFGVIDGDTFLKLYSTYLFGTVYLPFKPGTRASPASELLIIAHEYGHAYQDRKAGPALEWEIDYLDTTKRAVIEAECYAIGACMAIRYPGSFLHQDRQCQDAVDAFRTSYGRIPQRDINRFITELYSRVNTYSVTQRAFNLHLQRVTNCLDQRLMRKETP